MRKYQNKILIIVFIGILITGFGVWRVVEAADSSIYVSPAQANKKIGDTFDISVKVSSDGQKICVVEGKLNLNKLSCQKITMGSGISAQTSPSCDDLSFILGIQGCVTSEKTLFTVRVKAKNTGTGTASFTGIDIIGEGVPISFVSSGGSYTLTVLEEVASEPEEIIYEEEVTLEEEEIIIVDGEEKEPTFAEPSAGEEEIIVVEEGETGQSGLLAAIGDLFRLGNLWWLLLFLIIIIIILYWLSRKKKRKEE